jgi:hypothetical protein
MSAFGILDPAGAVALAAVAVLVVLHLRDRRRRIVPVASLLLWRQVPASAPERRRLRADPLFLLQLALLLALVAGYLRPYVAATGAATSARLLVVLDVSASMQTREDGGTRFDLARRRARALVAEARAGNEVMLLAAGARPETWLRWTTDRARVEARLEAAEPLDVGTRLAPALAVAFGEARAHPGTHVALVTDVAPDESGVAAAERAAVDWIQVGRTDDNVAITSLTVDVPPFHSPRDATATVLVRNMSHRRRHVILSATVGGEPWAERELTLLPRAAEPVLLIEPPATGIVSASLASDDALAVDDHAVAYFDPDPPLDLLVVSDSTALATALGALAATLPGSHVETVSPARFDATTPRAREVVVFDRFVPASPVLQSALYAAPPAGNAVCPSRGPIDGAVVIDWEPGHPVVGDLEGLDLIAPEHTQALELPPQVMPAVLASGGGTTFPLLFTTEGDGHRLACLGAELTAPLAASDRLPLLVLVLSTLRWLGATDADAALAVEAGVPVVLDRERTTEDPPPPGLRIAGDPPVLVAERTGVYHTHFAGGERTVVANLFDDRESDVGRNGGGEWPATASAAGSGTAPVVREVGWWLYLGAAALLALEWIAWLRWEAR